MSIQPTSDSQAFYEFLGARLGSEGAKKSPEELVQEWRSRQSEFEIAAERLGAAIADMEAGDQGKPLRKVAEVIRQKHGFAASNDP